MFLFIIKAFGLDACVFPRGILNGRCVECPVDTLYENVTSYSYQTVGTGYWRRTIKLEHRYQRCVKVCSPKNPYITSSRICVSSCLTNMHWIEERKYCLDESINSGFCDEIECSKHGLKCYYMQCFSKCPDFTSIYNNSCVIDCFEDKPFIFNDRCVKQCPKGYVLDNRVCQTMCPNGRYNFNETCTYKCPNSKKYIDNRVCVSKCPNEKVIQNEQCVKHCSDMFVLDGKVCKANCPPGLFEHNKRCVDTCPDKTFIENKKCVENCSSRFFQFESHCVAVCPPNYFINKSNYSCVNNCKGYKYNEKNNLYCYDDCPGETAKVNKTCVIDCPKSQPFLHGRSCTAKCPVLSKFVERKRKLNNIITYTCVEKCEKYTSSISNMCVDACSSGKVLFQNICQEQCPESDPVKVHLPASPLKNLHLTTFVNLTNPINAFIICAKECPPNFVIDDDECYVGCPNTEKKMILNSKCLKHCPETYPFVVKENNTYTCANRCKKKCALISFV